MPTRTPALTLPGPHPPAAKVPVPPPLPCYVILVHGVNDVGEAYEAQEQGLCWGLVERLGRCLDLQRKPTLPYSLRPAFYRMPKASDALEPDPDRVYYQRNPQPDTWSPVIPFYWGFREENDRINRNAPHGQWLDRFGNRLDRNGAKNGGPFANATNSLPGMWAAGWTHGLRGTINWMQDDYHPMMTCPPRPYMVLAALRLAALVDIIRRRQPGPAPHVAINLVAHSQGCLVSLLANAFLAQEGKPPVDALIMNHPPYSLVEPSLCDQGKESQTTRARLETLSRLCGFIFRKPSGIPPWAQVVQRLRDTGGAGMHWGYKVHPGQGKAEGFPERDNRGKVYLYFCPEDRTVALKSVEGIGWQGVPDHLEVDGQMRPALPDLGPGFRQRVFTEVTRGNSPLAVGLSPQHVDLRQWHDNEGSQAGAGKRTGGARATLDRQTLRYISGEALTPPITPDLHAGERSRNTLGVGPIDAAIGITKGACTRMIREEVPDPRPASRQGPLPGGKQGEALRQQVLAEWNQRRTGHLPQEERASGTCRRLDKLWVSRPGYLGIERLETFDESRYFRQREGTQDNSIHSAIVASPWHSQAVTAYDLALGDPIPWSDAQVRFLAYLCEVADWRVKGDGDGDGPEKKLLKAKALVSTGFFNSEDAKTKILIDKTSTYYTTGKIPPEVIEAPSSLILRLVMHQTQQQREDSAKKPNRATA